MIDNHAMPETPEIEISKSVCAHCVHHSGGTGSGIWWDQTCHHPELMNPAYFDYVTGKEVPPSPQYCRDTNHNGECDKMEPTP